MKKNNNVDKDNVLSIRLKVLRVKKVTSRGGSTAYSSRKLERNTFLVILKFNHHHVDFYLLAA